MFRAIDAVLLMPLTVFVPPLLAAQRDVEPTASIAIPLADGFDFPVGKPNAHGYYDAQSFGTNDHLGEDWNGNGGGNTDLGDPVHSVAHGVVTFTGDLGGGWGQIVRVVHAYEDGDQIRRVESFYAHLDTIEVEVGDKLRRGTQIGTIGDAGGTYIAHLHFELRDQVGLPHGPGYSEETAGYLAPTPFIRAHRRTTMSTFNH